VHAILERLPREWLPSGAQVCRSWRLHAAAIVRHDADSDAQIACPEDSRTSPARRTRRSRLAVGYDTWEAAVEGGHLGVIQWMRGALCFPWRGAFVVAAKAQQIAALKWMVAGGGYPLSEALMATAAALAPTPVVRLLVDLGCPSDARAVTCAAIRGTADAVHLLVAAGCPSGPAALVLAVLKGHPDVLTLLRVYRRTGYGALWGRALTFAAAINQAPDTGDLLVWKALFTGAEAARARSLIRTVSAEDALYWGGHSGIGTTGWIDAELEQDRFIANLVRFMLPCDEPPRRPLTPWNSLIRQLCWDMSQFSYGEWVIETVS